MKNIIVHTGYIPASVLRKTQILGYTGLPAHLSMLTPEKNIVEGINQILNKVKDGDTLKIATNNTIAIYAIRAYVVKHASNYQVEYRYYTIDDSRSNDESNYQQITQGNHGDFENAPEGFFDTIDNLLLQMLGIEKENK